MIYRSQECVINEVIGFGNCSGGNLKERPNRGL
jgi:hypothetical protein